MQENTNNEVVQNKRVPMTVEDYERVINVIGENLNTSIKSIKLAIEAAILVSNDEECKNTLRGFMLETIEIENDMRKAVF